MVAEGHLPVIAVEATVAAAAAATVVAAAVVTVAAVEAGSEPHAILNSEVPIFVSSSITKVSRVNYCQYSKEHGFICFSLKLFFLHRCLFCCSYC